MEVGFNLTIGPYATENDLEGTRKIIPYSSNKTASYVSNIFLGTGFNSPERNIDGTIKLEKKYCARPVELIPARFREEKPDLNWVADQIQQDIRNHIEVRLQLFLMQIMLLFQSKIKVHKFRTQAQAGDKNKIPNTSTLNPTEVHAGTLPNLIGNTEEEEQNSYFTDEIELKSRVFAKGTSYYLQANVTHKLPQFVNDVDSDIDFRTTEIDQLCDTFREQGVNILNLVSNNSKMTPQLAFRNFMIRILKKIEKIHPKSPPHQQSVLLYYSEVVKSYLKQNEDPNFIKRLMFERELDFSVYAHSLRQKMQFELTLLNKIGEIQTACHVYLNGTKNYDEAIMCVLILGSDNGRLTLLQERTSNLSSTHQNYHDKVLNIVSIQNAAHDIISSDPTFAWVDQPAPSDFVALVKREVLGLTKKKIIQGVNSIALRILWTTAKRSQIGNEKLSTFLCLSTEKALQLIKDSPVLGRNIRACLNDVQVKRLLVELMLLVQ